MSGIINSVGSKSGVIGTTVGGGVSTEEGVFTLVSSGGSLESHNQFSYTKIGNLVHVQGQVQQSANQSSGTLSFNLPFPVCANPTNGQAHASGTCVFYGQDFAGGDQRWVTPVAAAGSTAVTFVESHDDGAWTELQRDSSSHCKWALTYKTDD